MCAKVAVVTGGNKGIGFAIVKDLCKKFNGHVYLTARDKERGEKAVSELKKLGLEPKFHLLDVSSLDSIQCLHDYLKEKYDGLDALVNNAAIAYKAASDAPFGEQAENTIAVNFFDTLNVCKKLFPLLRPHARVVNISSSAGMLSRVGNEELQKKFSSPKLTEEELCQLMKQFVRAGFTVTQRWLLCSVDEIKRREHKIQKVVALDLFTSESDAKENIHTKNGWGNSAYSVSKVGVTALSFMQQREFNKDSRQDIVVNPVHPGYVDTDMTSHKGPLTPEQGAEAPVYAALLPPNVDHPRGEFIWNDKTIVQWK